MRLVKRCKSWTKDDRRNLGGQTAQWLGETRDWQGARLAIITSGPLTGATYWLVATEIEPEPGEGARA